MCGPRICIPRQSAGRTSLEGLFEEDAVRATLARDPWSETHPRVDAVDRWTIRLDGRRA
jgi:hypothetical protein